MDEVDDEVFARWLSQGLGRAHRYVRSHPGAHREALLRACVENPIYDRPCEGTRTAYLAELIQLTDDPRFFRDEILAALADPGEEVDREQLFEFALRFARTGDARARMLMYEQFTAGAGDRESLAPSTDGPQLIVIEDIGAPEIVALDGLDGFRFVAARLGEVATADSGYWDTDRLIEQLKEQSGGAVTDADIAALGAADPRVQRYLDVVAATMAGRERAQREPSRPGSLPRPGDPYGVVRERILGLRRRRPGMWGSRWGRSASAEELRAAADDLLLEEDPVRLAAYLTLFDRAQFPLGAGPLLALVRHEDSWVGQCAAEALALFEGPEVRALGLALLDEGWHPAFALSLLERNYRPEDAPRLQALLDAAEADDELHALGLGFLDVMEANPDVCAPALLTELYERGPCALCRERAVELLVEIGQVPVWMAEECRSDASEDIRAAVTDLPRERSADDADDTDDAERRT